MERVMMMRDMLWRLKDGRHFGHARWKRHKVATAVALLAYDSSKQVVEWLCHMMMIQFLR